ncbi:MAG TPA: acyl carrier protein [Dehalococcoidia bacterium]|nr:acyl carrier protein [Dehalococcoidia bacterium]
MPTPRLTPEHIEQVIKDHIRKEYQHDNPGGPLDADRSLISDGVIDSLGIFTLISFIEQEFSIKVLPEDVVLENFESVNTIKSLVLSRM